MLVSVVVAPGCSNSTTETQQYGKQLSAEIAQLRHGESVAEVEQKLGNPSVESMEENGAGLLIYKPWHLYFNQGALVHWGREVMRRSRMAGDTQVSDEEVLGLRVGMTWDAVRHQLGPPDIMELDYWNAQMPERVVRYRQWELRFRRNRLRSRTQW